MTPEHDVEIPLVVIDDHEVVHAGIRHWCAEIGARIRMVAAHRSVQEYVGSCEHATANGIVILYDPEVGEKRPDYHALQRLCALGHPVIIYSRLASTEVILTCLDIGAACYVVKSESPQHVIAAVASARTKAPCGGEAMSAAVRSAQNQGRPRLTDHERRVLIAWLRTESKALVASQLHIAPSTVKTHLQRIRHRYNSAGRPAPTKASLFARAVQDGYLGVHEL